MHSFLTLAAMTVLATALPHAHNHASLHARLELGLSPIAGRLDARTLSPVGECGGDSGFTCGEGFCCSQWGYCGQSTDYCGVGCQFGACDGSKETPVGSGSAANSTGSLLPSVTAQAKNIVTNVVFNVAEVTEYQTVTADGPHAHGPPHSSFSVWSSPAETHTSEAPAPYTPPPAAETTSTVAPSLSQPAPASSSSHVAAPPPYSAPAPTTTFATSYSAPAAPSVAPTPSTTYIPPPPSSTVWSSSSSTAAAPSPPSPSTGNSGGKGDSYTMYSGNGETSSGWPDVSAWMDFESLWETNMQYISISCVNSFNVPNNSDEESKNLKAAIQSVASSSGVDARFILAVVMQESKGCVRAPTTNFGVQNPGLMQDHNGSGTCNSVSVGGSVLNPCPADQITLMISEGTAGVQGAYGLEQNIKEVGSQDVSRYYKAARIYNSGSIPSSGDLGAPGATRCYSSDIANRLTGWVTASHGCTL